MDKPKIMKVVIAVIVVILAMVYYFSTHKRTNDYEDILTNNIVVENKTQEKAQTEEKSKMKVYVTGEVNIPGVIELEEGARIEDAVKGAGGVKAQADLNNINLAYEVSDGEKIYIPNVAEAGEEVSTFTETSTSNSNSNGKININKANATELTSIPGIGASTAQKIITYREENGKFQAIEDIKKVSGIGDSKYESMKDFIAVK